MMNLFKKKNKSEIPSYVSDTATLMIGAENGTLEDKRDTASYKWRLIAQEISEIVNK